jgi:hypothetical protein
MEKKQFDNIVAENRLNKDEIRKIKGHNKFLEQRIKDMQI